MIYSFLFACCIFAMIITIGFLFGAFVYVKEAKYFFVQVFVLLTSTVISSTVLCGLLFKAIPFCFKKLIG